MFDLDDVILDFTADLINELAVSTLRDDEEDDD